MNYFLKDSAVRFHHGLQEINKMKEIDALTLSLSNTVVALLPQEIHTNQVFAFHPYSIDFLPAILNSFLKMQMQTILNKIGDFGNELYVYFNTNLFM